MITDLDVLYSAESNLSRIEPMANKEHLLILKKGVKAWNKWRSRHPQTIPYLRRANLHGADLRRANLSSANLIEADLSGANLGRANLSEADLVRANLSGADLHLANLFLANLSWADLVEANLSKANLFVTTLDGAKLAGAILAGALLVETNLRGASLSGASLNNSSMLDTLVVDVDLSGVKGLETVRQSGPSHIGIDTVYRSKANIPESFLRGAGVPDDFITYMKSLVGNPIEFYSCFISYSNKDDDFAKRLYTDLQQEHVRCWFAPEDLKIGEKFRPRIDEAIRIYDKLLLILSESSIQSPWVEKEVETAFEKERKLPGKTVLFPIRLDDAVMKTDQAWAADIRRTRHIGDFSNWKNHDDYKMAFERLLRDLNAKAKNPPKR